MDVSIEKLAHVPSAEDFAAIYIAGSNLARSGVKIDDNTLKVIQAEVSVALKPYVQPGGLALPRRASFAPAG